MANRTGCAAMTRKTYCGNLLWQLGLTLLAPNRLSRKLLLSEIEERRERSFRAALVVLGSIGDETCISVLRDVVAKEDVDWVRERAKESLVKIQKRITKGEDAY